MLVTAITGFRSVHPGALALLESLHASRAEIFFKLRLPGSLPYIFAALKASTTLCVIGAVVGEWIGADKGLGRMIAVAYGNLDMPTIFAAILCLAAIGVALITAVTVIERRALFWHESNQER
jgi:NitT/TauT family transport system permease protein